MLFSNKWFLIERQAFALGFPSFLLAIKYGIGSPDIKPIQSQNHHNLHFYHCELLSDAVARAVLKRPSRALDRMQEIPHFCQQTLV